MWALADITEMGVAHWMNLASALPPIGEHFSLGVVCHVRRRHLILVEEFIFK